MEQSGEESSGDNTNTNTHHPVDHEEIIIGWNTTALVTLATSRVQLLSINLTMVEASQHWMCRLMMMIGKIGPDGQAT